MEKLSFPCCSPPEVCGWDECFIGSIFTLGWEMEGLPDCKALMGNMYNTKHISGLWIPPPDTQKLQQISEIFPLGPVLFSGVLELCFGRFVYLFMCMRDCYWAVFRFSWRLSDLLDMEMNFARRATNNPLGRRYQVDKFKINFHNGSECPLYLLIVCCGLGYQLLFPVRSKHLKWSPV